MARYAANTTVPPEKTKAEIERTVKRYGDDLVSFGWSDENTEVIAFRMRNRYVRFTLTHPDNRWRRGMTERQYEREIWRRWRVCLLQIKTQLELVEDGELEFDRVFLPYMILPDGSTVGDRMTPQPSTRCSSGA